MIIFDFVIDIHYSVIHGQDGSHTTPGLGRPESITSGDSNHDSSHGDRDGHQDHGHGRKGSV